MEEIVITMEEHSRLLAEANQANMNQKKADAYDRMEKIHQKTKDVNMEDFGYRVSSIIDSTNALIKGR